VGAATWHNSTRGLEALKIDEIDDLDDLEH
jgi:hypothetical protein